MDYTTVYDFHGYTNKEYTNCGTCSRCQTSPINSWHPEAFTPFVSWPIDLCLICENPITTMANSIEHPIKHGGQYKGGLSVQVHPACYTDYKEHYDGY